MTLTEQIKSKALELGFDKIGIAKASALTNESDHLKEWLHRSYHATMSWMEKNFDKRTNPQTILPNAQSVISVAINYYTPFEHSNENNTAKISRYAWGEDYHIHVTQRIKKLWEYIKQIVPSAEGKFYVDTGPVMDKVWAVHAGLGWIGKHTNLITKDFGSWVFLGEIISTLMLDSDTSIEDFCGTCTACIEACPTNAIREPYIVDSNRCLSYLTIEHRGEISQEYYSKFNGWIFGCDICQDVCPWNKLQRETKHHEFLPKEFTLAPKVDELVTITQEEFSKRFRNSPIKRAKLEGIIRNAHIVKQTTDQ